MQRPTDHRSTDEYGDTSGSGRTRTHDEARAGQLSKEREANGNHGRRNEGVRVMRRRPSAATHIRTRSAAGQGSVNAANKPAGASTQHSPRIRFDARRPSATCQIARVGLARTDSYHILPTDAPPR
eukprot:GHVU01150021.1.p1 GENE.GHVU01150021.1~~GHVU01150021.1.p1  ORF type:complete len:126 (-),score=7.69 GHVU01150021.1:88-465(-)